MDTSNTITRVFGPFYIASPQEKVWQALTQPEFTRQYFFGRAVQSDWRVGSPWRFLMDDGQVDCQGIVERADPPRLLSLTWRVEWNEELRKLPYCLVTYQIESLGEVTRLTVSETIPGDTKPELQEGGKKGWPIILSGLKTLLETGRPLPSFGMNP